MTKDLTPNFSLEELLNLIRAKPQEHEGYHTTQEWANIWETSYYCANKALRSLWQQGYTLTAREHREDRCSRRASIPTYSLTPEAIELLHTMLTK